MRPFCTETDKVGHICVSVWEFKGKWSVLCTETEKQALSYVSVQKCREEMSGRGRA